MIQHAIPNSSYFAIVQPGSNKTYDQIKKDQYGKTFDLEDPKDKKVHKAIFYDTWIYTMDELTFATGFVLLALGVSVQQLKTKLIEKYPELTNKGSKVEFWLMRKA